MFSVLQIVTYATKFDFIKTNSEVDLKTNYNKTCRFKNKEVVQLKRQILRSEADLLK